MTPFNFEMPILTTIFRIATLLVLILMTVTKPAAGQSAIACPGHICTLTKFDRLDDKIESTEFTTTTDDQETLKRVWAVNSAASKALFSGTIITVTINGLISPDGASGPPDCFQHDWKVAVLSDESSNVLVYGPADIGEFCDVDPVHHGNGKVLLVVPVLVKFAEISYYKGNVADPTRKEPSKVAAPHFYCHEPVQQMTDANLLPPPTSMGIRPCNLGKIGNYPVFWLAKLYNHLTQPGTSQGTLSFTPAIGQVPNGALGLKPPSTTLNFDAQLYPSWRLGDGWIGAPVIFEKAGTATANLNSFTAGVSYDIPLAYNTMRLFNSPATQTEAGSVAFFRPPDFRIQYGPELASSKPHDLNLVAAATVRVPIVLNFYHQPSALSIFPVAGLEAGNHVHSHLTQTDDIFRKVIGFDLSLRVPFFIAHAIFGDKPMTIDFAWRTRYLSYPEPLTNYVSGVPEVLTKQQRNYWRGSYVVPLSTLVQFKVSVQHGALPPLFDYLGYTLNIGLTFGNPGYSEH